MKIHIFQKYLGEFLIRHGNMLDKSIKVKFSVTFPLQIVLFGVGMGIGSLILNGIFIIILGFILVIGLCLLFGAISEFSKALLLTIGKYFIKLSETARFSAKIINQSRQDSLDKRYVIQISNKEWFANASDVNCQIGLIGHVGDHEDLQITKTHDEKIQNRFPAGAGGDGVWTDNDSPKIDIARRLGKFVRFIRVDYNENKFYVTARDYGKSKTIEIPCNQGKHSFLVSISGNIKSGIFYSVFNVEVIYRGTNDIELKIKEENISSVVKDSKNQKPLWA